MEEAQPSNHHKQRKKFQLNSLQTFGICLILTGLYMGIIFLAPQRFVPLPIHTSIDLNTADDATDNRDRIQIEKINLEVPFFSGDANVMDRGAWHRFPERGDPERGGNFILSAHRFYYGLTPQETKQRSPFYNVGTLKPGDTMRVYFHGKWYDYIVIRTYAVKPNAIEIEAPSQEAKLTLYTCTLAGAADGRTVIEAKQKF